MKYKLRYKEVQTIEGTIEADSLEEAKDIVKMGDDLIIENEVIVDIENGVDIEVLEEIDE
jgi:hypothetical protein